MPDRPSAYLPTSTTNLCTVYLVPNLANTTGMIYTNQIMTLFSREGVL